MCKKEGKVTSTLLLESLWSSWRHSACSKMTFKDLPIALESTRQTPKKPQRPPKTSKDLHIVLECTQKALGSAPIWKVSAGSTWDSHTSQLLLMPQNAPKSPRMLLELLGPARNSSEPKPCFLMKGKPLQPTYLNGGSWLKSVLDFAYLCSLLGRKPSHFRYNMYKQLILFCRCPVDTFANSTPFAGSILCYLGL